MSVSFVVVPLIAANWPLISAAILAGGTSLGYQVAATVQNRAIYGTSEDIGLSNTHSIELVMPNAQVVTDTLMRGESFSLTKGSLHAEFRVDGRGACIVHVEGAGHTNAELEAEANLLMDRVRQQFAYAKVMEAMESRGFVVQQQTVEESGSIKIRVQRV